MKKKFITLIIAALISIGAVGCTSKSNTPNNTANTTESENQNENSKYKHMSFKKIGLEFDVPKTWATKQGLQPAFSASNNLEGTYILGEVVYNFCPEDFIKELMKKSDNATTKEENEKFVQEYKNKSMDLFTIIVLDKSKEKTASAENKKKKDEIFAKYTVKEKIVEKDSLECYMLYNDKNNEENLSEKEKKEFKEVRSHIEDIKKSIKLSKPVDEIKELSNSKNIQFKTKTIHGKEIDNSIFNSHKLTMINIWATYCGPCISEMEELEKLYKEVQKENVSVLGIVIDTPNDEENQALAKQILDKKGVTFSNIIPDEKLINGFLSKVQGVPTTIFVDNKGNVVGKPIIGAGSKEKYKTEIQNRLTSLK